MKQQRLFDKAEEDWSAAAFLPSASNAGARGLIARWRSWPGGALALIGPPASGKTHLARIWAAEAGAGMISPLTPPKEAERALRAHGGRLAIDDVEEARDDAAIMALWDFVRAEGGALLLVGRNPPGQWPVVIPDLRSRFRALPLARLEEPDDELLKDLLRLLCRKHFIELRENVAKYLVLHMERSFAAAHGLVWELDQMMDRDGGQPVAYDLAREALTRLARRRGGAEAAVEGDLGEA